MRELKPLSRKKRFLLLALVPLYFMVIGLFLQPLSGLGNGLLTILREPDFLITDYFVSGGPGAALINAGLVTLLCLLMVYGLKMEIDGHTVTSLCLMFGFSLFGKNLLNIWLILLGVVLYSRFHKVPVSKYLYIGFYGTSLSPIITELMQLGHFPMPVRFLLAAVTGLSIGFVLPPLSTYTHFAHNGYSLCGWGHCHGGHVLMQVLRTYGGIETFVVYGIHNGVCCDPCGAVCEYDRGKPLSVSEGNSAGICADLEGGGTRRNGLSEKRRRPSDHVQYGGQWPVCHGLCAGDRRSVKRSQHRSYLYGGGLQRHRKTSAGHCTGHVRSLGSKPYEAVEYLRSIGGAGASAFDHTGANQCQVWCILGHRCGLFTFFRCIECGHRVRWHEFIQ